MDIPYFVIDSTTMEDALNEAKREFRARLSEGQSVAFVVRKGGLSNPKKMVYENQYAMTREEAIRHIIQAAGGSPIVSTTSKASRELFELRAGRGETHRTDFLTVGSMGHSSSIALELALYKPDTKIWCIDGDGSVLMHMGALAVIGSRRPENLVHVVINNAAHETVGGMPTVADRIDLTGIAKACGYPGWLGPGAESSSIRR